MDFLVDLLGDLMVEGMVEGSLSKRIPGLLRRIFAIIIILLYLALTILFIFLCISATDLIEKLVFGGMAALDIWFVSNLFKKLKNRKKR